MVMLFVLILETILLLLFWGYSVAGLASPQKKQNILLAPWLGTALALVVGYSLTTGEVGTSGDLLGWLGFKGYMGVWFFALLLLFYSLITRSFLKFSAKPYFLIIILFVFIGAFFAVRPSDEAAIIQQATHYQLNSIATDLIKLKNIPTSTAYAGVPLLVGLIADSLHSSSDAVARVLVWIYVSLLAGLLFVLIRNNKVKVLLLLLLAVFFISRPRPFYFSLFAGLATVAFFFIKNILHETCISKKYLFTLKINEVIAGLVLSSLALVYPLGFVIMMGSVVVSALLLCIFFPKNRFGILLEMIKITVLTFVISPVVISIALQLK